MHYARLVGYVRLELGQAKLCYDVDVVRPVYARVSDTNAGSGWLYVTVGQTRLGFVRFG